MSTIGSGETVHSRRQRLSGIPRACEACRVRKIRCDRTTPCSNCLTSGIICQGSSPPSDNRSKSNKVALLEERIEVLESRLRTVEKTLTDRNTPCASGTIEHERATTLPSGATNLYEGDSAFTNELLQVSQVAQKTAHGAPVLEASFGDIRALLESSSKLENHKFSRSPALRSAPSLIPLPFAVVAAILRRIKERTPIFCYGYFLTDISHIEQLCQKIYSFTDSVMLSHVTSVLGILYFILKELVATSDQLCEEHSLDIHLKNCEQSLKSNIETYELLAVPSFESILALAFGALKAQEDAEAFVSCTLISGAVIQCLTLGYHREKTYGNWRDGNAENARRLFWSIYISDKTLSLLLGRSSYFQDLDIDALYPNISTNPLRRPWDENFVMAIRIARAQGQIYDRLYSPASLKAPIEQRTQSLNELVDIMSCWRNEQTKIDPSRAAYSEIWAISRHHWDVIYYSTLTTLLRASKTPGVGTKLTAQCFHSARLNLESHMSCFATWDKCGTLSGKDYANWVLHYSSFTSFVVIFLHAISAARMEDVQLLDDVVETLNNVQHTSKLSERLYKICAILAGLSRALIGLGNATIGTYNSNEDTLHFSENASQSPAFLPETLQDSLSVDMTELLDDWEANDLGVVLANWANGDSTTLDMHGIAGVDNL